MDAHHDAGSGSHAAASGIDPLSEVLRSVHLTASMLFLVDARAPPWLSWAPRTETFRDLVLPGAGHMVSFHIVTQGRCWAGLLGETPEPLDAGDVLVIPHGDAYCLADPPHAERSYGPAEAVAFLRAMAAGQLPPTVTEGGDGAATTRFICGFLGCDSRPFNPILAALPRLLHVRPTARAGDSLQHLVAFALDELREHRLGARGVKLRLAELLFVEVVRRYIESLPAAQTGWLAGLRDAVVARALSLLHASPAQRWTLDALAAEAACSRSVLAERFARFVGQPPMQYLTQWRIQLASRLLAEKGAKVAAVADAVGYESEAAFGRAFKQCVGVSPGAWRRRRADG